MTQRPRLGLGDAPVEIKSEPRGEPLPSGIGAIIDGLDLEGLPSPGELAAMSEKQSPKRLAPSQLSKPGRVKRALKAEVHELQVMVNRMQAQVTGAASEIQELTRLVSQLVDKKQREEAEGQARQDQQALEEQSCGLDPCPTPPDFVKMERQIAMQEVDEVEWRSDFAFPDEAAYPVCAVKQGAGGVR